MKVFWSEVSVGETEGGLEVSLDGRPVRTPGRQALILPNAAFAEIVAEEWRAQTETVNPLTMPATRLANSAIEKVQPDASAVADHVASYATTDLLCYRAVSPAELIARQSAAWDPLLDWADACYGARLRVTQGIMPVDQDEEALARLRARLDDVDNYTLAAVHEMVTLSGSYILGLAAFERFLSIPEIWATSRIDESWHIEQWGPDDEDEALTQRKEQAFLTAGRLLDCLLP